MSLLVYRSHHDVESKVHYVSSATSFGAAGYCELATSAGLPPGQADTPHICGHGTRGRMHAGTAAAVDVRKQTLPYGISDAMNARGRTPAMLMSSRHYTERGKGFADVVHMTNVSKFVNGLLWL